MTLYYRRLQHPSAPSSDYLRNSTKFCES